MRLGIPHLGNLYIPLKALFKRLEVDYVPPPVNTRRTLSLGVKYAPEGLCMPFKLTLGNFIEIAELGADTLLMPGSYGTCRLGYYARTQEKVLKELGYDIEMVQLGVSEQKFLGMMKIFKRLANDPPWLKLLSAYSFCRRHHNFWRSMPPAIAPPNHRFLRGLPEEMRIHTRDRTHTSKH